MHERFGADRKLEDKSALEYAINTGRGSIWLNLSDEQYAKLAIAGGRLTRDYPEPVSFAKMGRTETR
jgi:hypothetical protein